MHPALVWLTLFVWTLALELPVYAALLRERLGSTRQACLLVVGVNLITHPALFLAEPRSGATTLAAEVVVAFVEGLVLGVWLGRPAFGRALIASCCANALSAAGGLALSALLAR
jgi:hypothetical protein